MKYNAAGQLVSDALGDGETEAYTYDTRLRLQAMSAVFGSTPVYSYSLTFTPNGNVLTANDSVNGNWNYSYDQFNRLVCASLSSNTACAMPPTGTPTYTYAYDRFGNRWQQNSPSGAIYTSSFSFTGNGGNNTNRMDSYSYDSAGNLLFDNAHHYFYDAENRLIQVDGTLPYCTRRVAKTLAAGCAAGFDFFSLGGAAPFAFKGAGFDSLCLLASNLSEFFLLLCPHSASNCSTASLSDAALAFFAPDWRACTPAFPSVFSRSIH